MAWGAARSTLWRCSPRAADGWRRSLLRAFGASVGPGVRIDPSAHVEIPWHLRLGADVRVGPRAILYSLGTISIDAGAIVGPFVHLCAGTHDYTDPRFTLLRSPIHIGERCILETASYVGPGLTLAPGVHLAPRAAAFADISAPGSYRGCPARPAERTER